MNEKKTEKSKISALKVGKIAAISPFVMFGITFFLASLAVMYCIEVLGREAPDWALLWPLLISPLLGLFGIIFGIVKIREKGAAGGILLSVLCLIENALLFYFMYFIGSRI